MAYTVQGKNCILYGLRDGDYFPFACGQELTLSEDTEMIPTTTVNSGKFRTFLPRFSDWKLSLTGVFFLRKDSDYVALELFTDTIRSNGLDIKAVYTDDEGAFQVITGSVLFPSKSITATVGQLTKWASSMQGNGPYTIDELDTSGATFNSNTEVKTLEYTSPSGGETSKIFTDLVNKTLDKILYVGRDGVGQDIIDTGTPNGKQVKFISATGTIEFPFALGEGEWVQILYK